mmetsp:Transcript_61757/g.179144  ORF Transcript_61757/g.179144 Transcript_61757/m.179144 type:complete len:247 (-) Transcript_61757:141-881(-)
MIDPKAAGAEAFATCCLVLFGCGSFNAVPAESQVLVVPVAFGMSVAMLALTIGHHSGAQMNPAVTVSLMVGRKVDIFQGSANIFGQFIGAIIGAAGLTVLYPCGRGLASLGCNVISDRSSTGMFVAACAEVACTFILCVVIWETAAHPRSLADNNAALAIGMCVYLCHMLLWNIDGCSLNPARSFGPLLLATLRTCEDPQSFDREIADLPVFVLCPIVGGVIAALHKQIFWCGEKEWWQTWRQAAQ